MSNDYHNKYIPGIVGGGKSSGSGVIRVSGISVVRVPDEPKSQVVNVLEDAPDEYSACDVNRTIINTHVQ